MFTFTISRGWISNDNDDTIGVNLNYYIYNGTYYKTLSADFYSQNIRLLMITVDSGGDIGEEDNSNSSGVQF